jgi:hypothetical protein
MNLKRQTILKSKTIKARVFIARAFVVLLLNKKEVKHMSDYKRALIAELVKEIKKEGFRVFLAKDKMYGFYTDNEGLSVVSFGLDICEITFSGNYKTDKPAQTGTGWRFDKIDTFKGYLNTTAPQWAVGGTKWSHTTLKQHLDDYQASSKYTEV